MDCVTSEFPCLTFPFKLADWLVNYAHSLELDVWTSANVTSAEQDALTHKWTITIKRDDASERTFVVNHLVFAVGIGGGVMSMPQVPGIVSHPKYGVFSPTN